MYSKQLKDVVLRSQFNHMVHYLYTLNEESTWKIHFTVFFKAIFLRKNGLKLKTRLEHCK